MVFVRLPAEEREFSIEVYGSRLLPLRGSYMYYLTRVIPVRLTSFAQGDCLPSIISIK